MSSRRLRSAVLMLSLLAGPMLGCEPANVQIQLDSFTTSGIEGIVLYREDTDGKFRPVCEIHFGEFRTIVRRGESIERVQYVQNCLGSVAGVPALVLETNVERPANAPDAIRLELWYLRFEEPGIYKASAFNAAGESALSAASLLL